MPQRSNAAPPPASAPIDAALRAAAVTVLSETGWDGLSLERVAEAAGLSRVTVWRQGVTKDRLIVALLDELDADFRASIWPALTAAGNGRQRLEAGLLALCEVADRHLPLLMASDNVFHSSFQRTYGGADIQFSEPFTRFAEEGLADGSIYALSDDAGEIGDIAFNTVCWTYVHLRGRHRWPAERARSRVVEVVLRGLTP